MNAPDEELQNNVEKGQLHDTGGLDAKAYQQVFRALKKEPGFGLPPDFAARVLTRAMEQRQGRVSRDYLWFAAGLLFLTIAFLATVLFIGFRLDFGFLNVMADYSGLAVFGISFIIFLNWLDKKLVRDRIMQHGI